jgi:hypothetical protein
MILIVDSAPSARKPQATAQRHGATPVVHRARPIALRARPVPQRSRTASTVANGSSAPQVTAFWLIQLGCCR